MIFNSFEFFLFLPTIFLLYWFVVKNKLNKQNLLLLLASYVFYGWWDWRFLLLIIFSSFIDYHAGLQIAKAKQYHIKKRWLTTSMLINLGFLGVFKYFDFFSTSLSEAFSSIGINLDLITLNVILPVGISFSLYISIV